MTAPTTVINIHRHDGSPFVYIGRPSMWGNPFVIGKDGTREEVLAKYAARLAVKLMGPKGGTLASMIRGLQGKQLGCFCKPQACHGDILAAMANAFTSAEADQFAIEADPDGPHSDAAGEPVREP